MPHAMMLFVLGLLPGAAETLSLTAADWPAPRRAEALATQQPLGDFLRRFDQGAADVLRIRHAGGEPDSRFAEQLRDALVALGVPAARIRLEPAAADAGRLVLEFSVTGEARP
jgi:type IV pilus biogenesis protein CpaD/CtpE